MVVGLGFLLWVVFRVDLLRVMVMVMVGLLLWVALLHGRLLGMMGLLHLVAGLVCLLWVVVRVGFLMGKMRIVPDMPQFHLSIAGNTTLSTRETLPKILRMI
jgi:hypothetical protein